MTPGDGSVTVAFHDGIDPRLLPAGDVEVACHLYDEEAKQAVGLAGPGAAGPPEEGPG